MDEAFVEARKALTLGEVPVGCVFVMDGKIIARGKNSVNESHNASRHAEMNCVDEVLTWCKDNNILWKNIFKKIEVYVTVEPCGMCADALGQLNIQSVFYGCSNDRFGGCGSIISVPNIYKYSFKLIKDVRKEEAINLLKEFYKGENPNAPTGKAKRKNK